MESYTCSRSGEQNSPAIWLKRAINLEDNAVKNDELVNKHLPADIINCRKTIAWLERGFVLSFYYLLRHKTYLDQSKESEFYHDCINQTIQEGGDTDTNACIVGGMIGALVGIKALPPLMVDKVINFDCTIPFKHT